MSCGGLKNISIMESEGCKTSFGPDTKVLCLVHVDHLEEALKKYPNSIICTLAEKQFQEYKENGILPDLLTDTNGDTVNIKGLK